MKRYPIYALIITSLSALACNAAALGEGPDSAATVAAVYATITAQAERAGVPGNNTPLPAEQDTTPSAPGDEETEGPTATSTLTPTPPESRSEAGPGISIARCTGDITIDGAAGDWRGISPSVINNNVYGANNWDGTQDVSAEASMCWTEQGLYVVVAVTDDVHVQNQTGQAIYKGDEIEIIIDGDLRGDYYEEERSSDDVHLGLSPGDFGDLEPSAVQYVPVARDVESVTVAASRVIEQGGSYILEASFPWTLIGVTPEAGLKFGLCLSVSDNDQVGEAVQESMVSSCPDFYYTDPTTWVTASLDS